MRTVVVERGQSLWSIARGQLPANASDATIQQAVRDIARANGLAPDARLRLHQSLVIPDEYTGVSTSTAAAEAMARLSTPGSNASVLNTRIATTARPLLPLQAVFSDTVRSDLGPVTLPDIAGKAVQAREQKFEGLQSSLGDGSLTTVDARLGTLTRAEFDAVHAELGGRSSVAFDPARDYRVVDFLPPALQALVNKDLEIPEAVTLEGTKALARKLTLEGGLIIGGDFDGSDLNVGLTMNCHAAAWEAARAYGGATDSVAVFYGEMVTMDTVTHDESMFKKVGEVDAEHLQDLVALGLEPGDLVQFHEVTDWMRMTMLLHTAVYVGGGLFFEKPNTEGAEQPDPEKWIEQEETPFRLTTLDRMAAPLSQAVDGHFRIEVLRPQVALDDPARVFGSSLQEPLEGWARSRGRALGCDLVTEFEQGMGGNIRAEYASALVRVPLKTLGQG